jgi:signal recognition particle receptor subunit beta
MQGDELSQLLEEEKMTNVPILVLANKQDLTHALPADEVNSERSLHLILLKKYITSNFILRSTMSISCWIKQ